MCASTLNTGPDPDAFQDSPQVHVVAAVIRDRQGRVLIQKRPPGKLAAGLWEFPGGKVHSGETRFAALQRELDEELGLRAGTGIPLIHIRHAYSWNTVDLDVWELHDWQGEACGREGQEIRWVTPERLGDYDYPAANLPVIRAARLPDRYLVTASGMDPDRVVQEVARAVQAGVRLVQFRNHGLADASYRALADRLLEVCRRGSAALLLNRTRDVLDKVSAHGLHLTQERLFALDARPISPDRWLGASVHDENGLRQAENVGVDFVTLGPVQATASHPDRRPMGWARFAELARAARVPVFAQGGLAPRDIGVAREAGAQGISAIRAFTRPDC